jgi:hypothetical protein
MVSVLICPQAEPGRYSALAWPVRAFRNRRRQSQWRAASAFPKPSRACSSCKDETSVEEPLNSRGICGLRRLFETNFFRRSVRPYRLPQSAFPSDLGIGAFLEALCYDPCLLFRRSPPPPLSGDQLDTTIRTAFPAWHLPSIHSERSTHAKLYRRPSSAPRGWGPRTCYS